MRQPRRPRDTVRIRSGMLLGECLERLHISERELSRRAGLAHATVNHLSTGRRATCSLATGRAIEAALGIEHGHLFTAITKGHQ